MTFLKIIISVSSLLVTLPFLNSCNSNCVEETIVLLNFENGIVKNINDKNIDVEGKKMFDSVTHSPIVRTFAGDILKIHYTNSTKDEIDHIDVVRTNIIPLIRIPRPGANPPYFPLYVEDENVTVVRPVQQYMINEDNSYTSLDDPQIVSVFGSYHISEIEIGENNKSKIYLHAVYTFEPNWF